MSSISVDIKQLLEAGAHFGHKTSRWHPKMAPFIHSKRAGGHIIDLNHTVEHLDTALAFIEKTVASGKQVLLVSTKPQAQASILATALAVGMPYVSERWLGGMLTNQNTIGKRIKHLKDLEERMANGELAAKYSKLEVQRFAEEIISLNHMYGGIKNMQQKPGALFIIDIVSDDNAVKEARKLGIPVVALVDTNADPTLIDYPIASNDDATKTINLILNYVQQAIAAGQAKQAASPAPAEPAAKPIVAPAAPSEAPETKIKPEAEVKPEAKSEPKPKTETKAKKGETAKPAAK